MKFKKHSVLFLLGGILLGMLIVGITQYAFGLEQQPSMTLYRISTDEPLTIAWDDTNTDILDYFDFYMWNSGEQKKYLQGNTQQLQITVKLPRTGLYVFYCRSCDKPESDDTRECSVYAQSDMTEYAKIKDPATGQFINGKWMIYGHVAAPTGGGVVTTP